MKESPVVDPVDAGHDQAVGHVDIGLESILNELALVYGHRPYLIVYETEAVPAPRACAAHGRVTRHSGQTAAGSTPRDRRHDWALRPSLRQDIGDRARKQEDGGEHETHPGPR